MKNADAYHSQPVEPARGLNEALGFLKICLLGALLIGQGSNAARAEFVLGFDQSNYLVDAGQEFDVSIYLTETGADILATDGLNAAGVVLSFNLPVMASDPAQVTGIAQNAGVSVDDDLVSTTMTQATATEAGSAELMFSIFLGDTLFPDSGASRILLGVFHFRAGAVPGEATNLSTAIPAGGPQFYSGTDQALDDSITTSTAVITVRPDVGPSVPEPQAILLLASGLLVQAGWLSHRNKGRRDRGADQGRRIK